MTESVDYSDQNDIDKNDGIMLTERSSVFEDSSELPASCNELSKLLLKIKNTLVHHLLKLPMDVVDDRLANIYASGCRKLERPANAIIYQVDLARFQNQSKCTGSYIAIGAFPAFKSKDFAKSSSASFCWREKVTGSGPIKYCTYTTTNKICVYIYE